LYLCFFFQAEDGIRDRNVTGVQTCALPISCADTAPGAEVATWEFFDTVALRVADAEAARVVADRAGYNIRVIDDTTIGVSFGERSEERRVGNERRLQLKE